MKLYIAQDFPLVTGATFNKIFLMETPTKGKIIDIVFDHRTHPIRTPFVRTSRLNACLTERQELHEFFE